MRFPKKTANFTPSSLKTHEGSVKEQTRVSEQKGQQEQRTGGRLAT